MGSDGIRFVVLAYARLSPTIRLIHKIRDETPNAQIQVFLDHPRSESSQTVVENHQRLLVELRRLANDGTILDLVARERNLGTTLNLIDALDRIHKFCDGFVVLEDDCDPAPLFFDFARDAIQALSQEAKAEAVIFSGANHLFPPLSSLSRSAMVTPLSHVWGWGGLSKHLPDLTSFIRSAPSVEDKLIIERFIRAFIPYAPYRNHWGNLLEANWGELSWDYRLQFWIWARGYKCLIPGTNLVRNTGFDSVATNSQIIPDHYQNRVAKSYRMQRKILLNRKFLIWWELTGYRVFALVRLIRLGISGRGKLGK